VLAFPNLHVEAVVEVVAVEDYHPIIVLISL
jgi:hypothetical protein